MNILVEIDVKPGMQWWNRWNQSLTSCGLNPHPPGSLTSPTWPWAKNPPIGGGRNSPVFVQEFHILWHMYNHIGLFVFCWLGLIHSEKGFKVWPRSLILTSWLIACSGQQFSKTFVYLPFVQRMSWQTSGWTQRTPANYRLLIPIVHFFVSLFKKGGVKKSCQFL